MKASLMVQRRDGVMVSVSGHDSAKAAILFWARYFEPWAMSSDLIATISASGGGFYGVRDPKIDAEINKFISGAHLKENEQ